MIRYKKPDIKTAQSLIESAVKEMNYTMSLKISEDSGSTIIRNVYECFRKLGDAILTIQGIKVNDHIRPINALTNLKIETNRPLRAIENLRQKRHTINYNGYIPTIIEIEDAIDLAKELFNPIVKEIKKNY